MVIRLKNDEGHKVGESRMNPFDITGKVIAITGGNGQLGRQWIPYLQEQGATVHNLDLPECDVTKLEDLYCGAMGIWPDGLICAAALDAKPGSSVANNPWQQWDNIIGVNLSGVAKTVQMFTWRMKRGGSIVLVGSMYGMVGPDHRRYGGGFVKPAAYSVSKSALYGLCRYLAVLLGPKGIRINVVTFGAMASPQHPERFTWSMQESIPLGRLAEPGEWNGPIQFLLSDASSYMTGANLVIDGGYTAR